MTPEEFGRFLRECLILSNEEYHDLYSTYERLDSLSQDEKIVFLFKLQTSTVRER